MFRKRPEIANPIAPCVLQPLLYTALRVQKTSYQTVATSLTEGAGLWTRYAYATRCTFLDTQEFRWLRATIGLHAWGGETLVPFRRRCGAAALQL